MAKTFDSKLSERVEESVSIASATLVCMLLLMKFAIYFSDDLA